MNKRMMRELRTNVTCVILSIAIAIGTFTIMVNVSPIQEPAAGYETMI